MNKEKEQMKETKKNPIEKAFPRKHKIGSRVRGQRMGSRYHNEAGTIIYAYVTLNNGYRNQAYLVKLDNGKIRSFQHVIQEVS